jgi:aminopeptidase N
MFFGNQLSYEWWSYMWLAEGFCTFYQSFMAHKIYPEMGLVETFAAEALQIAFIADSSPSIHPMTFYVEKPSELDSIVHSVIYFKGEKSMTFCFLMIFFVIYYFF